MSDIPEERTYYIRIILMCMDLTKETILKVFKYLIKSEDIAKFLASVDTRSKLEDLFKRKILNKTEYNQVCSYCPNPDKFDIALLIRLIIGLCKNEIAEPQFGWTAKPHPKDESLGADLIRLRNVRNKIIGHLAYPKLSYAEYENIKVKFQAILVRVTENVDPSAKEDVERTIDEYTQLVAGTENTRVKMYLDQLAEYKNEVDKLQDQVEELTQRSLEFQEYFEKTPELYVRYIKLLFDGGQLVLCGILERELDKHGESLVTLVSKNRELLMSNIDTQPPNMDHTSWDVGFLASVILVVFVDMNEDDRSHIEIIKTARLCYADHAFSFLHQDDFMSVWTDLISSLKHLSMNIAIEKKQQVGSLINRYKKRNGDGDADEYLDQLRRSGLPVNTLKDKHKELVDRLKHLLGQLKDRGIKFKTEHVLKIKILTTGQNEETKKNAEDFLERNLQASFHESDLPVNFIRTETDKLVASITAHPDTKMAGVERSCILLSFKSSSPSELIHILDYCDSKHFQARLRIISKELQYLYEDAFLLQGNVTLESLSKVIKNADNTETESYKGLSIPMKCSSVDGIRYVLETLKKKKTTNRLNNIAEKISRELNETVSLNMTPDLLEFRDVFDETDSDESGSGGINADKAEDRLSTEKEREKLDTDGKAAEHPSSVVEKRSSEVILNERFTEKDLNDTIQQFRKRYEIEIKSLKDAFKTFFGPSRNPAIKKNITRELSLKNRKPKRSVNKAQGRPGKGTLNPSNDSIRAQTAGTDKVQDEIDVDPYTWRLYTKALQEGKETDRRIRINVVGNFSQGKTSLIRRLVGQSIDGVETTNGIDIDRYICKESHDGKIHYGKSNNDDDSSAFRRLSLIARSIESDEVEHIGQSSEIDETIHKNLEESAESEQSPIDFKINDELLSFLYLMKTETREEVVKTEKELPVTFDIWDFGGQYIFYATHTIFHSRNAIYLLVMDLTLAMEQIILDDDFPAETADRNVEYFIKFWMNSIHSFVGRQNGSEPHVILVGTHKDKIYGDENTKQQYIEKYFEDVRMLFDNTEVIKHIHSKHFAVDNKSLEDTGIELLGKEIIKLGTEKATEVLIPAKWIPLEESLQKRRSENIIAFAEVKTIDAENIFPLDDEEQIKLFLKYHHSKGTLLYFDEEPVSEYVVINPQYLIDAFRCIITSERFCKKNPNIRPLWSRLVKEARLENDLIDFLWRREEGQHFIANRTVLLSLLKKHHIISEVMDFDEQRQSAKSLGWYIVPSLLKNRITKTKIDDFLQGKRQTIIRIALLFENSAILPTVCHHLFAAALGKWCVASFHKQMLLFEDFAVFRLDMYQVGIIKMNLRDSALELQVLGLGCSAYLGDSFRRFLEAIVNHEFRKFDTIEHHQPYRLSYSCNHKSHGIDGSKLVELSLMKGKDNVPCPDLETHNIPVAAATSQWFLEDKIRINDIPKRIPSEKELSKISTSVAENWKILGVELGLSKDKIDILNEDNRTAVMKSFRMLMEWREQLKDRATIDVLIEAVKRTPQVQIDWDIIRNIIDEMKEQ